MTVAVLRTGAKFDERHAFALGVNHGHRSGVVHPDGHIVGAVVNRSAELNGGHCRTDCRQPCPQLCFLLSHPPGIPSEFFNRTLDAIVG